MLLATRKRVIRASRSMAACASSWAFRRQRRQTYAGRGGATGPQKGHVRPHRDGCNEEEQYQLYESNAHEQFFLCICQISGKSFIIVV